MSGTFIAREEMATADRDFPESSPSPICVKEEKRGEKRRRRERGVGVQGQTTPLPTSLGQIQTLPGEGKGLVLVRGTSLDGAGPLIS